ncbi:MAG: hypothetical protein Q9157_000100 [Trypethelium eluteriae]
MAPVITPRGKKRDNIYFDVGKQGRKTGITLKDNGIRDADGLEPIDGIFSSPEKSPPKRDHTGNKTQPSSEIREAAQNPIIEPVNHPSAKRLTGNFNNRIPPPGRSPMKTALGSSPRRPPSLGPPSRIKHTPNGVTPPTTVNRKFDYSVDEITPSIEQSPDGRSITRLNATAEGTQDSPTATYLPLPEPRGQIDSIYEKEESQGQADDNANRSLPISNEDDSVQIVQNDSTNDPMPMPIQVQDSAPERAPARKGKSKQNYNDDEAGGESQNQENRFPSDFLPKPRKKSDKKVKRGAKASQKDDTLNEISPAQNARGDLNGKQNATTKVQAGEATDTQSDVQDETQVDLPLENGVRDHSEDNHINPVQEVARSQPRVLTKKRGRPRKDAKGSSQPPTKRQKGAQLVSPAHQTLSSTRSQDTEEHDEESSHDRDAFYKAPSSRGTSRAGSSVPSTAAGFKRPGARSLTLLRQGTPTEDDGARMTRSGRTSVKPFKWWLNEGYEYHRGQVTGVTRAEEVEIEETRRKERGDRRRRPRLESVEEEAGGGSRGQRGTGRRAGKEVKEEDDLEEWEESGGILTGMVRGYDNFLELGIREEVQTGMCDCAPKLP